MTKNIDSIRHNRIDAIKFILMVGVVMIHSGIGDNEPDAQMGSLSSGYTIVEFFAHYITALCVPFFYIISGYLFFKNYQPTAQCSLRKLKGRFRTLFIPYVLWCTIAMSIILIRNLLPFHSQLTTVGQLDLSFPQLLKGFWSMEMIGGGSTMPYDNVLWFIRDLLVVVLIHPLVYFIVKHLRFVAVVLLWVTTRVLNKYELYGIDLCMLYFGLGSYIAIHKPNYKLFMRYGYVLGGIYLLYELHCVLFNDVNICLDFPFEVCGCVGLTKCVNKFISTVKYYGDNIFQKSIFFVYAAHGITTAYINKYYWAFFCHKSSLIMVLMFFVLVALTFSYCLLLYVVTKRLCPKLLDLLTGGRQ